MLVVSTAGRIARASVGADGELRTGEVVADGYVVRGVLGTGGMGRVYDAEDLDLRRPVAIKIALDDAAQLRREAQALAQVHDPHVVGVYRFGVHRAIPFLAMERLYGTSVDELIATTGARGVELPLALEILAGVAHGLAALHAAGIAHLDLAPGNVMVCGDGRIVLVDLGMMVAEVHAGPRRPCGTPLYMAPELIEGALAPGAGALADVYSFGALAHELLCGAPPFPGDDVASVMACHLVEPPPDLRARRPEVPPRLASLVRACLAKQALDRPTGADELAWELRAVRSRR